METYAGAEGAGTIAWTPRSPDLTSLDFSYVGIIQGLSYCSVSSCKFGRTTVTDNRRGYDHTSGHDS